MVLAVLCTRWCATATVAAECSSRATGLRIYPIGRNLHVGGPVHELITPPYKFVVVSKIEHSDFVSLRDNDRAVREVPTNSRHALLKGIVKPRYFKECKGTPRQEYQENVIDGIRVKPTFNPYVQLNKKKRYILDNYASRLSKRYVADVRKQYLLNGLPWVWDKFFYAKQQHFGDREPIVPKIPYLKELREVRTKEALLKMNDLVFEYRKQSRERKNPSWLDKMAEGMAGAEIAHAFTRKKKEAS
ncbi:BIR protein [Cardiosporidium cionae]|uniref:BIR protein n=1 Tax=Cardiosporidium cionae TaxID=476202 RepID=A0ABQ7JGB4_9APIC|nr:BIR protein [Cardiosporidium cionae]|eukprot:KAF8823016.1 BIR protein [Cardiosporidium cionae]